MSRGSERNGVSLFSPFKNRQRLFFGSATLRGPLKSGDLGSIFLIVPFLLLCTIYALATCLENPALLTLINGWTNVFE